MKKKAIVTVAIVISATVLATGLGSTTTQATNVSDILPAGGVALALEEGTDLEKIYVEPQMSVIESAIYAQNASVSEGIVVSENSVSEDVSVIETAIVNVSGSVSDSASVVTTNNTDLPITELALNAAPQSNSDAAAAVADAIGIGTEISQAVKEEQAISENEAQATDPENFSNLVIAQVTNYVNVRDIPSEDGEVVGKLYDDSVGSFLEEENGWYKITSGNVTGYVKAEYCVTGDAAIALAKEVGVRMATVNTTTLKVRTEPSTESEVLGLVPIEEDLSVLEEVDGWVKVSIEEGEGYISTDYVILRTDFVTAESKEEEEARLEAEEAARREAQAAAAAQAAAQQQSSGSNSTYVAPTISGDGMGTSVAQYACQFVGNPYVYGGSSLTNGTDCSGFVMSVYSAFGVSLPHSSSADRSQGYAVEGGLANAQPGDIVCYSGHVGIYIGGGQIVHASTSRTGIIISNASYRSVLAVRRIF
ncbi:MAG TPA: SH3 domain-containing protein [Lachnospiraceae bacterium]|nr:SH3 domain-containing protein [Lachnospiraceae bacterium]